MPPSSDNVARPAYNSRDTDSLAVALPHMVQPHFISARPRGADSVSCSVLLCLYFPRHHFLSQSKCCLSCVSLCLLPIYRMSLDFLLVE